MWATSILSGLAVVASNQYSVVSVTSKGASIVGGMSNPKASDDVDALEYGVVDHVLVMLVDPRGTFVVPMALAARVKTAFLVTPPEMATL